MLEFVRFVKLCRIQQCGLKAHKRRWYQREQLEVHFGCKWYLLSIYVLRKNDSTPELRFWAHWLTGSLALWLTQLTHLASLTQARPHARGLNSSRSPPSHLLSSAASINNDYDTRGLVGKEAHPETENPEDFEDVNVSNLMAGSGMINIPHFDGRHEEWIPFWDMFNALVHSQKAANVLKFNALRKACSGEALAHLKRFPQDGRSYHKAVEALKSIYGDPKTVYSLTTDEFLLALSRFTSRRGAPDSITSDNGTTFVMAAEIAEDCMRIGACAMVKLDHAMAMKKIKWNFNVAAAPWQAFEVGNQERLRARVTNPKQNWLSEWAMSYRDSKSTILKSS
ncbi:unnamed protein product [Caenorhabditis bovis]|uniref:Integrase catalytic domain-containing protein n=1 Tax=Caenorhabditis bovis TaxID=2654633 RepID=A0A8S1ETL5_9PELO|nr:unnamed protein product [Caenorhabditis bovis]